MNFIFSSRCCCYFCCYSMLEYGRNEKENGKENNVRFCLLDALSHCFSSHMNNRLGEFQSTSFRTKKRKKKIIFFSSFTWFYWLANATFYISISVFISFFIFVANSLSSSATRSVVYHVHFYSFFSIFCLYILFFWPFPSFWIACT